MLLFQITILVFIGIVIIFKSVNKNPNYIWYLIAILALFASFNVYTDPFDREVPTLVFPLQQFKQYGRIITVGFLLIISLQLLFKKHFHHYKKLHDQYGILKSLLIIQFFIFIKNMIFGDTLLALVTMTVFILLYMVFTCDVAYLLKDEKQFKISIFTFISGIGIFIGMTLYQSFFNPTALFHFNGRFLGMTGNPQHAAVLLTSGIPILMVFIIEKQKLWKRVILIILLLLTIYYLIVTGSRTGIVMAFVVLFIFLIGFKTLAIKWLILGSIFSFLLLTITKFNPFEKVDDSITERYQSIENTRENVMAIQIRQFLENPFFGANPKGERIGFAENSYLAVAASLGIVGLFPLVFMIRGIIIIIRKLWWKSKFSNKKHFYLLVIAGLLSLLAGAFTEAYLLGNMTWPIILLLCYVYWGYYLLQKDLATPMTNLR